MSVYPKTITAFLDSSPSGTKRAAQAAALAQRWDAHLVGIYVVFKGVTYHPSLAYARHEKAIAGVVAHERRVEHDCECTTAEVGEHFTALCAQLGLSFEFLSIGRGRVADKAIINSLHSDLLIIGHPEPNGLPDDVTASRILHASGVPLLIIPNDWNGETIGERIMIGWNASPEARRAVSDAMCLLLDAKSVEAVVVDPEDCKWLGAETGCDLVQHLGRHGVRLEVAKLASRGRPIPEVVLDHAMRRASDLLVVGARPSIDLRKLLQGGPNRFLQMKIPVPVLIAR
ncbi:MAG: universal stress protein [Caulobacteraceae bacterium]|nr:universal stress protein [Caulobacteraceae bacterium]